MRYCTTPRRIVMFPLVHTWVIGKGPTYGYSYLSACLLRTNTFYHILYLCSLRFLFSIWLFLSIIICLRGLISSQSAMNEVFNIMSLPRTSCTDVACSVVWYVLHIQEAVADNVSDQGSSSSRQLFVIHTYAT